jgi:uncharacterized protein YggE
MKWYRIGALALLGLAIVALAGVGRPEGAGGASTSPSSGITVTGNGSVKAVPNQADFSLGVQTHGSNAADALTANSERMRRVIAALEAAGIAKTDVQTQEVSVSPDYSNNGQAGGYTARNTVSVKIRDLAKAGNVIDAASKAGANNVYGPTLSRSDQDHLQAKALRSAFDNARVKAQALADAANVRLGSVSAITEGFNGLPEPMFAPAGRAASSDAKAPVQPGTQDIQATVTVTFAIG